MQIGYTAKRYIIDGSRTVMFVYRCSDLSYLCARVIFSTPLRRTLSRAGIVERQ